MSKAYMPIPHGARKQKPDRIIIHCMGEFINTGKEIFSARDFLNRNGLSAHSLITPSGVNIRLRHDEQGAYHARGNNTNSLGMEFLVPGVHNYGTFKQAIKSPYLTDIQKEEGIIQVREWIMKFGIKKIDRHSDVDPSRKIDPGEGFDWEDFMNKVITWK